MLQTKSRRLLPPGSASPYFHIDLNESGTTGGKGAVLIKRTEEGWKPVEKLDGPVDRFTLEKDYAYWQDREHYAQDGWPAPWNSEMVLVKQRDGVIDSNELEDSRWRPLDNLASQTTQHKLGGEIVCDEAGNLSLVEHFDSFHGYLSNERIDWQSQYRKDDSNWVVSK